MDGLHPLQVVLGQPIGRGHSRLCNVTHTTLLSSRRLHGDFSLVQINCDGIDSCLVGHGRTPKLRPVSVQKQVVSWLVGWRGGGEGGQGLTCEKEGIMCIPGRVLLRLEQRIKVPEAAVSSHSVIPTALIDINDGDQMNSADNNGDGNADDYRTNRALMLNSHCRQY